jgi:hypothetical protein
MRALKVSLLVEFAKVSDFLEFAKYFSCRPELILKIVIFVGYYFLE